MRRSQTSFGTPCKKAFDGQDLDDMRETCDAEYLLVNPFVFVAVVVRQLKADNPASKLFTLPLESQSILAGGLMLDPARPFLREMEEQGIGDMTGRLDEIMENWPAFKMPAD
jgi:hypothetical protein